MAGVINKRTLHYTRKSGTYDGTTRKFVFFSPLVQVNHSAKGVMWEPRQDELLQPEQSLTLSPENNFLYPTDIVFVSDFGMLFRDKYGTVLHGGNTVCRSLHANVP